MPKCDFDKVALNFIEITLRNGCSPVNLLHILRAPFPRSTSGWLFLTFEFQISKFQKFHTFVVNRNWWQKIDFEKRKSKE